MENSINNEVVAASNQAASVFTPSSNPFDGYLAGEERAFKITATGLLYPFSQPSLWESLIGQGFIVKVKDEQNTGLESKVMGFIPSKDWEGLKDFLNNALKPDLLEGAKKEIAEAKLSNPNAPKYSIDVKRAFHHLHYKEGWAKTRIGTELDVTYPTVRDGIKKIDDLNKKAEENAD